MLSLIKSRIKLFLKKGTGWSGNYPNWQQAQQKCTGYDAANILTKVKTSILKVKNGDAVFEKDSVLFYKATYSYPLLSTVLWVALKNDNKISVIDYGGSLGSTYFQHKKILDDIKNLHWNIVEQKGFVEAGRNDIQDDKLQFFSTIKEAHTTHPADLLIISCAIQYMAQPYSLIAALVQFNFPYILIDNTPYNYKILDRITVQKVPPAIYTASYPCWFLDYEKVKQAFAGKYSLASEYDNEDVIDLDGRKIRYRGFLMQLKK